MVAAHPRILGSLGRALSLELSAVQQYMTHANLAQAWGEEQAAERFRHEAVEEMQHSERIIQRMIQLG
ncbi:MAG: ferritin-like domain-containing protein, partial [bacterium]